MSQSSELGEAIKVSMERCVFEMDEILKQEDAGMIPFDSLRDLLSGATRLYAKATEAAGIELVPVSQAVSTTEALMLACALLRSQHLNMFDMSLWFSRLAPPLEDSLTVVAGHSQGNLEREAI